MQDTALRPVSANDLEVLEELNRNYIRSVQGSDLRWLCVSAHLTRG